MNAPDGFARGGSDHLVAEFRSVTASLMAARGLASATASADDDEGDSRPGTTATPVTLLTGFLGSGKTTVLRRLLAGDHGLRLTAIVNDLGSINVDAASLGQPGEQAGSDGLGGRLDLANGCACCQLNDDLGEALATAVSMEVPPDAIVIEASGAADPVAMATTVEASPELRLDGIVCLVDAERWPSRHETEQPKTEQPRTEQPSTELRQIEAAHLVLLSKIDLISAESVAAVIESIAAHAPGRRVIPTIDGVVDPAVLLGAATLGAGFRPASEPHELTLISETVAVVAPVCLADFGRWLETDHRLLRAKGWVEGDDGKLYELQLVGRRWTLTATTADHRPAVVLIADDRSAIDEAIAALAR